MLDANSRARNLYLSEFQRFLGDPYMEPLFQETLAYDLVLIEYGYSETVFRYAANKYELKNDKEVAEYLDQYYQNAGNGGR